MCLQVVSGDAVAELERRKSPFVYSTSNQGCDVWPISLVILAVDLDVDSARVEMNQNRRMT